LADNRQTPRIIRDAIHSSNFHLPISPAVLISISV
jgi:hypothetical protein